MSKRRHSTMSISSLMRRDSVTSISSWMSRRRHSTHTVMWTDSRNSIGSLFGKERRTSLGKQLAYYSCGLPIERVQILKCRRFSKKKKASAEVWCGESADKLPTIKVAPLVPDIFAAYSGPDKGLACVYDLDNANTVEASTNRSPNKKSPVCGARSWNQKSRKAYGICMSLYDQHPINGKISGDPIADAFAVCARKNNSILVVADGVNWGEKSKLAARCAVYGCVKYLNEKLFCAGKPIKNTQEAFNLLLHSLDFAHDRIIEHQGGLTTLCVALVCPIKDSKQFVICVVNVGDSLGFVWSKRHGVREITTGSHDIEMERDIRDAGGALGPVNGTDPELHNLTCSMTFVDPGDIVYLTTDGISDNFDPVVTKLAMPRRRLSEPAIPNTEVENDETKDGKPEMAPHERHRYAVKEMEKIIHEFELFTETSISAQELCGSMLQHVLALTDPKRKVLENPELYGKKLRSKERKRRDSEIVAKMSIAPGKLDHATIVAYEVGNYHGNDDEDYEAESEEEYDNVSNGNSSAPTTTPDPDEKEKPDSTDAEHLSPEVSKELNCLPNGSLKPGHTPQIPPQIRE